MGSESARKDETPKGLRAIGCCTAAFLIGLLFETAVRLLVGDPMRRWLGAPHATSKHETVLGWFGLLDLAPPWGDAVRLVCWVALVGAMAFAVAGLLVLGAGASERARGEATRDGWLFAWSALACLIWGWACVRFW